VACRSDVIAILNRMAAGYRARGTGRIDGRELIMIRSQANILN